MHVAQMRGRRGPWLAHGLLQHNCGQFGKLLHHCKSTITADAPTWPTAQGFPVPALRAHALAHHEHGYRSSTELATLMCNRAVLLGDYEIQEKLFSLNRERIPERVVHARGTAAKGYFEVCTLIPPHSSQIQQMTGAGHLPDQNTISGQRQRSSMTPQTSSMPALVLEPQILSQLDIAFKSALVRILSKHACRSQMTSQI